MSALGQKQTCALQNGMSALHPITTAKSGHVPMVMSALPPESGHSVLFDHLVGALLNRQRDRNVKRPRGFEIDDQLELDRKLVRLTALENSIGVSSGASVVVDQVAAIGH